jgi:flagellar biogenesis protein FliO
MPHKTTELTYKASHAATKSSTSHHEAPTTSHHETPLTKEAHATEPVAHEPPATPPQAKVTTPQPSPPVTPTKAPPLTYKQAPLGGAQGGAATKGLTQVLLGLLGVLGLVFLVAKLAKIYLPLAVGEAAIGGGLHKLQVLDTLTLGAHHQLKLVAGPQGEQLLLAQTAQGLSLLKSWPANSTTIPTLVDDTLITLDDYLDEAIIPLKSKRG